MRVPKLRLRSILSLSALILSLFYVLLVLNVTIVFVQNDALEPSVMSGQFVFLSHDQSVKPGDVVALETSGSVKLRRVFAMGPTTVACAKEAGFVEGQAVPFTAEDKHWVNENSIGNVNERWGLISVRIKRNMKLVPQRLSALQDEVEVPAQSFLVGCQNRVRCGGCGFKSVTQSQVVGRMRAEGFVYNWLDQISSLWR